MAVLTVNPNIADPYKELKGWGLSFWKEGGGLGYRRLWG
jgi:hypothetical protein